MACLSSSSSPLFFYSYDLSIDCVFLDPTLTSLNSYSRLFLQTLFLPLSLYPLSICAVSLRPLFLHSVSSPCTVSIEAPLSVLYLRLTSCVLKLHSLLWGRAEWIERLTENSEEANPCLSSQWAHLLLRSCPLMSSRLLCPKTLLWPILSLLPPAAHCASCLRWGVIFMEDVFSEGKKITHKRNQSTDWIFVPISIKLRIFGCLIG